MLRLFLSSVRASSLLLVLLLSWAAPVHAEWLATFVEEAAIPIFDQIDDFAIDSCDPPCDGLICCDNHVCVHTVLACGAFPIHIDSFRVEASPRAQMAGFATQGVLAAEHGRRARLWFGQIDGEAWQQLGIAPGLYELTLEAEATSTRANVLVTGRDSEPVARLGGHFWVFSDALDNVDASVEWDLRVDRFTVRACHQRRCVQLDLELE